MAPDEIKKPAPTVIDVRFMFSNDVVSGDGTSVPSPDVLIAALQTAALQTLDPTISSHYTVTPIHHRGQ